MRQTSRSVCYRELATYTIIIEKTVLVLYCCTNARYHITYRRYSYTSKIPTKIKYIHNNNNNNKVINTPKNQKGGCEAQSPCTFSMYKIYSTRSKTCFFSCFHRRSFGSFPLSCGRGLPEKDSVWLWYQTQSALSVVRYSSYCTTLSSVRKSEDGDTVQYSCAISIFGDLWGADSTVPQIIRKMSALSGRIWKRDSESIYIITIK